ncbi:hypothetical protein RclHR1_01770017 [Rhizophagus clarus]|uniref:Crinkler effector protein N-terminal domain-containing protein n=1 Tax=Rhizophagus clarus TaxID=94130 RepID=A0A2Z6QY09_9GLOM|nr:hypothetical protein RclHR1_01770017 [Rhizophagus clarus]
MSFSFNCLLLGETSFEKIFRVTVPEYIISDDTKVFIRDAQVGQFKNYILSKKKYKFSIDDPDVMNLWKVEINIDDENKFKDVFTVEDIKRRHKELKAKFMNPADKLINDYFSGGPLNKHVHIIIAVPTSTAGPSQGVLQVIKSKSKEEVLSDAESHWTGLKDKLIETIELEEFRVSNHKYENSINASGIPVINGRPSFILHSLPGSDNEEGYLHKETLAELLNNVMKSPWLFLLGTSGSGKTRSLYELLCKTFGIYLSLSAGNVSRNLGSQDIDVSISELVQYLTNDPEKNTIIALRFTRAILLGRLFILSKLLESNQGCNRNFTPKQWLLMQLLPRQISGEDFWVPISRVFRGLSQEDQDELISKFIKEFQTEQEKLPIAIDESQLAITKHEARFSRTLINGPLRPFFAILLRTVLNLSAGRLCLILSGTGMSFDDIKNRTDSAIAKSGGATFKNFFSIHDGFDEYEEMKEFILRFLPLNDELIRATFNIFRGRRQFLVQFMESALLDIFKVP